MSQILELEESAVKLRGALRAQLDLPGVELSFRDYVSKVEPREPAQEQRAAPAAMVQVLKAGALFGGLLSATCRLDLLKLAEAGNEEARRVFRELVGSCAIYPGTFDPFTLGHGDVVRRAARLFDQVVVAIGVNPAKKPLFSVEERIKLVKEDLKDLADRIEVVSFNGSLAALAKRLECKVVLRGVRSVTDYEQELQLAHVNLMLSKGGLETLFIPAREGASFVSSTVVKSVVMVDEDASSMVSPAVLAALHAKRRQGSL